MTKKELHLYQNERLIPVKEAASILACSKKTVIDAIHAKRIVAYKVTPAKFAVSFSSLMRFLNRNKI
jgi:excisionase family DNA binding protein